MQAERPPVHPVAARSGWREAPRAVAGPDLEVRVVVPEAHVIVRGDPAGAWIDRVAAAIDLELPRLPGRVKRAIDGAATLRAIWLGPDEWMIGAPLAHVDRLLGRIGAAIAHDHVSVVDVSGGRCSLDLRGARVAELLASGCDLDLDPRVFGVDSCAQTSIGRIPVLIEYLGDREGYRVTVRPSFAHAFADWLEDAAAGLMG